MHMADERNRELHHRHTLKYFREEGLKLVPLTYSIL
jgi:hypothetical protein